MNLTRMVAGAFAKVPASVKTRAKVSDGQGGELWGTAFAVPARGTMADTFAASTTISSKSRIVPFLPETTTFAPKQGMILTLGTENWAIMGVAPLNPQGTGALKYRLTVQR